MHPLWPGAVISQVYSNGEEKPTAYASRTLASSEVNYSQLEKGSIVNYFCTKKVSPMHLHVWQTFLLDH